MTLFLETAKWVNLYMCSWYTGKATVDILLSHVFKLTVPICLIFGNHGERARILNSATVTAPREKDNVLGEMWTNGCPVYKHRTLNSVGIFDVTERMLLFARRALMMMMIIIIINIISCSF